MAEIEGACERGHVDVCEREDGSQGGHFEGCGATDATSCSCDEDGLVGERLSHREINMLKIVLF